MKQTREEIIELYFKLKALEMKAVCREVDCSVLDALDLAIRDMKLAYDNINKIIEEGMDEG